MQTRAIVGVRRYWFLVLGSKTKVLFVVFVCGSQKRETVMCKIILSKSRCDFSFLIKFTNQFLAYFLIYLTLI